MTAQREFPQFFITAATPCPYLPGQVERKVFTHLGGPLALALNNQLSHSGFRRSQNIAYRPFCESCQACVSVRVPVEKFRWSRSFRRVMAQNADLSTELLSGDAVCDHYPLFRNYIATRHGGGGMAEMSEADFAAMIDCGVVNSRIAEYRFAPDRPRAGALAGAVLLDLLDDGLSMVYSYFDPALARRSVGTFLVLDTIRRAARLGLEFVYLGYWVKGSRTMNYKARYLPQQRLGAEGWVETDAAVPGW
jgi:arginine-tRNA-protein transferase